MKKYCVYCHDFPNGKKYIGITSDVEKRWRNGKGYETQGKIANAIKHFGWNNIKHEVLIDGLTQEQAEKIEAFR
jgi:predicted GIY-YIG superfamily endonuclease